MSRLDAPTADSGAHMDRDELAEVFYGRGAVPPPWATDCPVRFDAWLALARPRQSGSEVREDLILSINEDYGVLQVLGHINQQLRMDSCELIASGSFIVAKLTLRELLQAVLPMTNLNGVIHTAQELAQQVGQAGIDNVLSDHPEPTWTSVIQSDPKRRRERTGQLKWFLTLLRNVAAEPHADAPNERRVLGTAELTEWLASIDLDPFVESKATRVPDRRQRYSVTSVTTNREASSAVVRSRSTIKADAAEQLFSVDCSSIGWAIVDSGIDTAHPAFGDWEGEPVTPNGSGESRIARAFNFVGARRTLSNVVTRNGVIDWSGALPYVEMQLPAAFHTPPPPSLQRFLPYEDPAEPHGTHIAGILGGWWPSSDFRGICPKIRLYDFRVLDAEGRGDEFSIVTALQAIRYINEQAGRFVIAGVNLSLSVRHDVASHSTGWTPVCIECNRLARSGVVVVAAAGNSGYAGSASTMGADYRASSISDPGNAESVITVGSTHRSIPHRHGVSYFSGRGPTGDGRPKPDLLAPGEDIDGPVPGGGIAAMHGTSQAAAHVSGAAAMLLARNRELLGSPERVKQILCATATDLARKSDFQGHGLVDVLRAMQSV